jgi:hypothetical protein
VRTPGKRLPHEVIAILNRMFRPGQQPGFAAAPAQSGLLSKPQAVMDDCGTPLTQGKVSVQFSTGQGVADMQTLNNGRWDLTWDTGAVPATQVTLMVHAAHLTLPISGDAQISGALGAPQAKPQVKDGGVVTAATFTATALAPGSIIAIFGLELSDATSSAPVLPLATTLNYTTVTLGDGILPLFYTSTGQVNAVVPIGISVNTRQQLLLQRDDTYAPLVGVDLAQTQPWSL